MSSLARSFAALYCQKLRSTTRLGPATAAAAAAPPRRATLGRPRFVASSAGGGKQEPTPFFTWARLAIGSVLAAAAPFLHSRWASLLRIQSEVEAVKDTAEVAAAVVEQAAAAAEMASAQVAEQLPEDGRLRAAAVLVEHASKEVAQEAHLARDIIHKVDEIEEDVKAIIEPIVDLAKQEQRSKYTGN